MSLTASSRPQLPEKATSRAIERYGTRPLCSSLRISCIDTATRTDLNCDVIGTRRPLDVPGVRIDGPTLSDIEAYEFPEPYSNSFSDINQDGTIFAKDLLLLQGDLGR